jgi:hypothetical protein
MSESEDADGGGDGDGCLNAPYTLGSALAVVLSWDANHALLWAILHGLLSWFYVIYYVIVNWSQVKWLSFLRKGCRLAPAVRIQFRPAS